MSEHKISNQKSMGMIFSVIFLNDGCDFNLILKKLERCFNYSPNHHIVFNRLTNLSKKNVIRIDEGWHKNSKGNSKYYKKFFINHLKDNPYHHFIKSFKNIDVKNIDPLEFNQKFLDLFKRKKQAAPCEREKMIFSVILYHDGCTINVLQDKLADYFSCYPDLGQTNRIVANLIQKNIIAVDKEECAEDTNRHRQYVKVRRRFYINRTSDNPYIASVEESDNYIDEIIEKNNSLYSEAKADFLKHYREASRTEEKAV